MIKYLQNSFIGNGLLKKFWAIFIILGIIFFIVYCVATNVKNAPKVLPTGEIEYDFMKQSQPKASKILYEYMLKRFNMTPKEAEEQLKTTSDVVGAFEYDLNDDGQKEIIGHGVAPVWWSRGGPYLFILEKHGQEYENISAVNFSKSEKLYISTKKINGYKKLVFYIKSPDSHKIMSANYKDGYYTYIFPEK